MSKRSKYPVIKTACLSEDAARAVEDYRFSNRISSESKALRDIILAGLAVLAPKQVEAVGK